MMHNNVWQFPLPRPHTGITLGNGCLGVLVWGFADHLILTVNRADFWDRRGGELIAESVNYAEMVKSYDPADPAPLLSVFRPRPSERPPGWFRSTRLPGGRFELQLREKALLKQAVLNYHTGELTLKADCNGKQASLSMWLSPLRDLLVIDDPEQIIGSARARPAWEWVAAYLSAGAYAPPEKIESKSEWGWTQTCPADPALAAVLCKAESHWVCSLKLSADAASALESAREECASFSAQTQALLRREARKWWKNYWQRTPQVCLPDNFYQTFLNYALYKFACATNPSSKIPSGLQGPWIEEYQPAPWGGDYHFNVNIQQIYTLAFPANHPEHLLPLFDMLESESFQTTMRRHARILVGISDGLALTHTTNDRGAAVGGVMGPGASIDHAALGWLAQLYWLYYLYTGDQQFLRERAWRFMVGVMRTYEAMLKATDTEVSLPLGISAEYRNQVGHSAGPNPSYQLACIHFLLKALKSAARILDEPLKPCWNEILQKLPPYTLIGERGEERFAIWEDQDLDLCHRHHSHLACIYPFDSLDASDWDDPDTRAIIDNSLDHWILKGMGSWSEWCLPWAAILQARAGLSEAPLTLLEIWRRLFVNEGLATVYLPKFRGISSHRRADITRPREENEIMQLDGTMAGATALYELLVHTRAGLTRFFAGVPHEWADVSFQNIQLPGPFTASATRKNGVALSIELFAPLGGSLHVAVTGQTQMRLEQRDKQQIVHLPVEIKLAERETIYLRAI